MYYIIIWQDYEAGFLCLKARQWAEGIYDWFCRYIYVFNSEKMGCGVFRQTLCSYLIANLMKGGS